MAVDCIESPNEILVNEINSTVEFRGLQGTSKVDIAEKIIGYAIKVAKK